MSQPLPPILPETFVKAIANTVIGNVRDYALAVGLPVNAILKAVGDALIAASQAPGS